MTTERVVSPGTRLRITATLAFVATVSITVAAVPASSGRIHAGLSQAGSGTAVDQSRTLKTAVDEALQRLARASLDNNPAAIAAIYAPDGEIANAGQPPIAGRPAIQAFLQQFSDFKIFEYVLTATSTTVDGDRAIQTGTSHQRVRTANGQVVTVDGTFTAEWVQTDGAWLIRRMRTAPK